MRAEQSSWSWSRGFAAFADNAPLVAWALIVLGLGRGVMILALRNHLGPSAGAWSVVSVFLNSLRFDLRTATLLAAPSLVLSVVAARWNVDRLAIKLRASIAVTFAAITAVLVAIDIAYFKEFGNQFDHFLFGLVFDDRVAIARTVWSSYPVAGVFAAGILALAVAAKTAPPFVAAPRLARREPPVAGSSASSSVHKRNRIAHRRAPA